MFLYKHLQVLRFSYWSYVFSLTSKCKHSFFGSQVISIMHESCLKKCYLGFKMIKLQPYFFGKSFPQVIISVQFCPNFLFQRLTPALWMVVQITEFRKKARSTPEFRKQCLKFKLSIATADARSTSQTLFPSSSWSYC